MEDIVKLIESKIEQLRGEVSAASNYIAQLTHNVIQSKKQIRTHMENVHKLNGAIEAFQSAIAGIKSKQNSLSPISEVIPSDQSS